MVGDGSGVNGGEVPAKLRLWEDDDDVRDDEAKTKAWSTWSGTARVDVEVRTETLRRRRDPKVDRVVDLLHEKGE